MRNLKFEDEQATPRATKRARARERAEAEAEARRYVSPCAKKYRREREYMVRRAVHGRVQLRDGPVLCRDRDRNPWRGEYPILLASDDATDVAALLALRDEDPPAGGSASVDEAPGTPLTGQKKRDPKLPYGPRQGSNAEGRAAPRMTPRRERDYSSRGELSKRFSWKDDEAIDAFAATTRTWVGCAAALFPQRDDVSDLQVENRAKRLKRVRLGRERQYY